MSFPPLHPSQNSIAPGDSKPSSAGSARPRQPAWGLSAQSTSRRGLTPLSTNVPPSGETSSRRSDFSTSPSTKTTTASSFAPTFSSVLNSASRSSASRQTSSVSPSASPFAPFQPGLQQLSTNQLLSSPQSRATTPLSTSNLASSAAASTTASQGGGGGSSSGGGPSRPVAFSPSPSANSLASPTTSTLDRTFFGASASAVSSSQSSVSKISVAQVFLLLSSITEKEGKTKWDSQAEAIRKVRYRACLTLSHISVKE